MVPVRGIEPRVDPYHGPVLPLYYTGSKKRWPIWVENKKTLYLKG